MTFAVTQFILMNIYCTECYPDLKNNIEKKICKFFVQLKDIVALAEMILTKFVSFIWRCMEIPTFSLTQISHESWNGQVEEMYVLK